MRIDATKRSSGVAGKSGIGKSGSSPAFVPVEEQGAAKINTTSPVMPAAGLDAILALQAVGDFKESRRKAVKRGATLLELLEEMKSDLLIGRVSPERLDAMVTQLGTLRDRVDPDLDALLDDIELRVRVELAKLGRFPQL